MSGTQTGIEVTEVVRYQIIRWTRSVKGGKHRLVIDRVSKEYDKRADAVDAADDLRRGMGHR